MVEHLWKAFELYLNRKDKFIKAEERLKRRLIFFEEVKKINANNDLDEHEKRTIRNSLAQIVCGSRLVDYELVQYYQKNKNFRNFEVIAPIVAYWDESINKELDETGKIKLITLDEKKYAQEKRNMIVSTTFLFFLILLFLNCYERVINALITIFYLDSYIALYVCGGLFFIITFLAFFAFYGVMIVYDLRRLVKAP
ncbi:hypothetical protein [Acinetobacter sp. NIPH 2699]|uniref:hypothetical protein n=1 Tax=Acinetobacter sp. NIPH 2699 TaxID=2923433 RepID=UPI001F4A9C45|nr:hypothetical protein [Acinetobacter sp. NIPH 2699]MCH7337150.1 hypothetical protein [Acinetobacter sp. NIPH 2699]